MTGQSPQRFSTAVVQGASRGIGLELARQLAARGTRVFATCRRPSGAERLAELAAARPNVTVISLDVSDEASIAAGAAAVATMSSRVDLLVNVAGFLHTSDQQPERRVAEVNARSLSRSFAVNAAGPILVARHFEALLGRSDAAVFAALSARVGSIADNRLGGWYSYRASKAALNMLVKTLAIEWRRRPRPITCLTLHPGTVATDLSAPFVETRGERRVVFPVGDAVTSLLAVIDSATLEQSGALLAYDGSVLPF